MPVDKNIYKKMYDVIHRNPMAFNPENDSIEYVPSTPIYEIQKEMETRRGGYFPNQATTDALVGKQIGERNPEQDMIVVNNINDIPVLNEEISHSQWRNLEAMMNKAKLPPVSESGEAGHLSQEDSRIMGSFPKYNKDGKANQDTPYKSVWFKIPELVDTLNKTHKENPLDINIKDIPRKGKP